MAFVKLDAGILNSTIWVLRPDLEIFITALLMASPVEFTEPVLTIKIGSLDPADFTIPPGWYGLVEAAGPGIINRAHIDLDIGMQALERLASPEPESRSQDFGGRRMVRIDGGFVVLNFMRYRDKDHTAAERQRRLRARNRKLKDVTRDSNGVTRDVTDMSRDSNVTSRIVTQSEIRDQRSEDKEGWVSREVAALPDPLKHPDFIAQWEIWLVWWAENKNRGRPMSDPTAREQWAILLAMTIPEAIQSLKHSMASNYPKPYPPSKARADKPAGDQKPRIPPNVAAAIIAAAPKVTPI